MGWNNQGKRRPGEGEVEYLERLISAGWNTPMGPYVIQELARQILTLHGAVANLSAALAASQAREDPGHCREEPE